jgi:hypothetical protein
VSALGEFIANASEYFRISEGEDYSDIREVSFTTTTESGAKALFRCNLFIIHRKQKLKLGSCKKLKILKLQNHWGELSFKFNKSGNFNEYNTKLQDSKTNNRREISDKARNNQKGFSSDFDHSNSQNRGTKVLSQ